jgi:hypothetical protein
MYCQNCLTDNPNTSPRCLQCGKAFFGEKDMSSVKPKARSKGGIGVLGWIAGLAVGWYSGVFLLMLLACTIAFWWLGKKLLTRDAQVYVSAIALQAGQTLLLVILALLLPFLPIRFDSFFLFDVVVPVAGLTWLVLKPGLNPNIFLTVFQVCAIVVNGLNFSEMTVGTLNHKALATHILWRCLALLTMWQGYIATKNTGVRSLDLAS